MYENKIPAIVSKDNVFGIQFHPEKSGTDGMRILKNFEELIK
jgi:glutamine amidotransferase